MIKKLSYTIFSLIGLLLILQVCLSSWRATDGDQLSKLQAEISQIEIENNQIKNQIYKLTSIDRISDYALLSHMKPAQITNLSSINVALRRQ